MREVKISSRTIYHKYCEVFIEIPKDIAEDKVSDWLFENEDKWSDAIDDANGSAQLDFGFGLGDGMDDKEEAHERSYSKFNSRSKAKEIFRGSLQTKHNRG